MRGTKILHAAACPKNIYLGLNKRGELSNKERLQAWGPSILSCSRTAWPGPLKLGKGRRAGGDTGASGPPSCAKPGESQPLTRKVRVCISASQGHCDAQTWHSTPKAGAHVCPPHSSGSSCFPPLHTECPHDPGKHTATGSSKSPHTPKSTEPSNE